MNLNTILAVLIVKKVIKLDEAQKISEHLANVPQSTVLTDAVEQVEELFGVTPDKKSDASEVVDETIPKAEKKSSTKN